ncbi:MAG: prephenate dehydratase domain-containing protein, partial [Acidimicrobiia bacterium]
MRIGYQGEELSYSHQATGELFSDHERVGFPSFVAAFEALRDGEIERLVVPIENSTTGSVLPVLDRLLPGQVHITAEH